MTDTVETTTDWKAAAEWAAKETARKDALLRQALEALECNVHTSPHLPAQKRHKAAIDAITSELAK